MSHFVDPKNYFGPGPVPPLTRCPAGAAGWILRHLGQVGAQGSLHPQSSRSCWITEPGGCRWPGRLCNPCCSRFSSALTLSAPLAGFVMQRKLLKEPRQTDRKPSLSLRGHIVCPGLNLNIKRPYLLLLFINPELCALKTSPGWEEGRRGRREGQPMWRGPKFGSSVWGGIRAGSDVKSRWKWAAEMLGLGWDSSVSPSLGWRLHPGAHGPPLGDAGEGGAGIQPTFPGSE